MKRILEGLCMIGMIAVMAGFLMVPAMAAINGSSEGSFTLSNSPPVITQLNITGNPATLDPDTEYTMEITVSDMNTLNDLNYLWILPKYKGSWTGPWYVWESGTWTDVLNAVEWPLGDSTDPELNNTVGTFYVNFTISKVATESADGDWGFDVYASDFANSNDDIALTGFNMNWRGEITTVNPSFDFGSIALNDISKPIISPGDGKIDITVIANGNYSLDSKSDHWTNGSNMATLASATTLNSGEFSLENDGANSATGGLPLVENIYDTISDYSLLTGPTVVEGVPKPIYVWVSVASEGLLPGTYSGNYYAQIVNG
ncbi:MAG: hypothetical protein MIO93_12260 [ANME-2 cluster archaeon]|nr:hypothetical protein [ANME-2 cluster archaeon]